MLELIKHPWPWYVAGPLIGLTVPVLLIAGNKTFGISSNLRHICAACFPAGISFFSYDWKKETWNLLFITGVLLGGAIAATWLASGRPVAVDARLTRELAGYGVSDHRSLLPGDLFNFRSLLTLRGFLLIAGGGFLVGFGTRYAGGCTSGHAIMGLSNLQWPSLVATCCFMIGGFVTANLLLPVILRL